MPLAQGAYGSLSMDDSPENIRQRMDEIRGRLARDFSHMADAARAMTDWRTYVRRYPWIVVGSAAVIGFMLAGRPLRLAPRALESLGSKANAPASSRGSWLARGLARTFASAVAVEGVKLVEALLARRRAPRTLGQGNRKTNGGSRHGPVSP